MTCLSTEVGVVDICIIWIIGSSCHAHVCIYCMYVCMYVCICICMYMYLCMYVKVYVCIYKYLLSGRIREGMFALIVDMKIQHVCMYVCMYAL